MKPEFEGLWGKTVKKYDADDLYKTQVKFPACFKSKMEKVTIKFLFLLRYYIFNQIFCVKGSLFKNAREVEKKCCERSGGGW